MCLFGQQKMYNVPLFKFLFDIESIAVLLFTNPNYCETSRVQRVGVFNFGTDRVRVLETTSGSGSGMDRVRVLPTYI